MEMLLAAIVALGIAGLGTVIVWPLDRPARGDDPAFVDAPHVVLLSADAFDEARP